MGLTSSTPVETVNDDEKKEAGDGYPALDTDGRCLSYKDKSGRWVNWWGRDKPAMITVLWSFMIDRWNQPGIPDQATLDAELPVTEPYFIRESGAESASTSGQVRATWIGHATVLAELGSTVALTDPIFSDRCSPVSFAGPKRYRRPACNVGQLPEGVNAVVISHTHYDHLDIGSCRDILARFGDAVHWFVPDGTAQWMRDNIGVGQDQVHELTWWEELVHPDTGDTFVFTPNNHWSQRGILDQNRCLWGSWGILAKNGKKFWFGGDTAYCEAFSQVGDKYGPFDVAAIPIGAYSPRETMRFVHINPEEAVKIHVDLKSARSFGVHWATFPMTFEPVTQPRQLLREEVAKQGVDEASFTAPNIGETVYSV